jgi:hypothetical protein
MIRSALLRLDSERYRRTGFDRVEKQNASVERLGSPDCLDLVTIAFNNPVVIGEQVRLLRKNLADPFEHTIADGSPDPDLSVEIRAVCADLGVPYLHLPSTRGPAPGPSMSHGRALNWVVVHYLRPREAHYFGFLDHDVFPIRRTSVISKLSDAPVWGLPQEREGRWYLWPGLSFFDARRVLHESLDFRPGTGVDTGGRNWETLYSTMDRRDLDEPAHSHLRLREGDGPIQSDHYEAIGDWIHTFNASHWMAVEDRDELVAELLGKF